MRILIVSDIHANAESLRVLPTDFDEVWILGGLVNYGPNPVEVIDFARANASLIVRGNHDHAIGFGKDPRCSARFRAMAEAAGQFTRSMLSDEHKQFLRELPTHAERKIDGVGFFICHALPSNPLYEYCPPDADRWREEMNDLTADVLLTGHTHLPFQRKIGTKLLVNPGSLGQPKHGRIRRWGRTGLSGFAPSPFGVSAVRFRSLARTELREPAARPRPFCGTHQYASSGARRYPLLQNRAIW